MKLKFVLIIASLLFVAAACNRKTASNPEASKVITGVNNQANPTPPPALQPDLKPDEPLSGNIEVEMTSNGLIPAAIKIKKGTTVTFINKDTKSHWPASNPHPTHTDLPGFDPKAAIVPGASWSYTFTQAGPWKFHDHLQPTHGGTITVVE